MKPIQLLCCMSTTLSGCASRLRHELCARNAAFASSNNLTHVSSYGAVPVIVYPPQAGGLSHGNFFDRSYTAILKMPEWARRLEKIHTNSRRSLPRAERAWRELDSCMSSDALLMNIFCCPGVCNSPSVAVESLPRTGERYVSYQLIRNVLAAHAAGISFCVMADARRPDLLEAWHAIMRCVRHAELRTRCKVLTWQELSTVLPRRLQKFLEAKYGISISFNHQ